MDDTVKKDENGNVLLFHRTTGERASTILSEGFRDGVVQYGPRVRFAGVWVSNIPLRPDQGVTGGAVLRISASLTEGELAQYEWKEERLMHREWLLPAGLLNAFGAIELDGRSNCERLSAEGTPSVIEED